MATKKQSKATPTRVKPRPASGGPVGAGTPLPTHVALPEQSFHVEREQREGADEAFRLDTPDGVEELAEERGETFVENVTGADDAATEHRERDTLVDLGGGVGLTGGTDETETQVDAWGLGEAIPESLPHVSVAARRTLSGERRLPR